jgi:recombinational DNA repair ATPase RecF
MDTHRPIVNYRYYLDSIVTKKKPQKTKTKQKTQKTNKQTNKKTKKTNKDDKLLNGIGQSLGYTGR